MAAGTRSLCVYATIMEPDRSNVQARAGLIYVVADHTFTMRDRFRGACKATSGIARSTMTGKYKAEPVTRTATSRIRRHARSCSRLLRSGVTGPKRTACRQLAISVEAASCVRNLCLPASSVCLEADRIPCGLQRMLAFLPRCSPG